jgi:SAM-dependent methyltransferase
MPYRLVLQRIVKGLAGLAVPDDDRAEVEAPMQYSLRDVEQLCQLNPDLPVMDDRANELAEYLKVPVEEAQALYRAFNVDKSRTAPSFDPSTFSTIIAGYTNEKSYTRDMTRLMLHYTRFAGAAELLTLVRPLLDPARAGAVIDYGCGVSDYGLAFAKAGYKVTLIDFEPGIAFASWRYRRRGLPVETIVVNESNEYPRLPDASLVMAGDLLEHVRDPRQVIRNVNDGLRDGGFFWFPDFPFKEKSVGGHHLAQAAAFREESAQLVQSLFTRVGKIKYLMQKGTSKP